MELSISFVSEDDIRFDKKYIISDRDKDFIEKLESI
jgi:hypothetical protein